MSDVLICGDYRSPALRQEISIALPDLSAYAEHAGKRYAFSGSPEIPRLREAVNDVELVSLEDLGLDGFVAEGKPFGQACAEAIANGCQQVGISDAITPSDFPLEVAEVLQGHGITVRADGRHFESRRRAKSEKQILGVRAAQRAAEAAVGGVSERIREGDPVDTDELRALARRILAEHSALPHDMLIIACGPQGADPHNEGSGPIEPHKPIIIDIFPRDIGSGCWGDLTRTVCLGDPGDRLRQYHADVLEAVRLATAAVRPGVTGGELHRIAAEYLARKGHQTRLDRSSADMPSDGFIHSLGHGVGLDVHEEPWLDEGGDALVAGDVVTIEPGVYYPGFGGVRIEDLVLVTGDGHEVITQCSYELGL